MPNLFLKPALIAVTFLISITVIAQDSLFIKGSIQGENNRNLPLALSDITINPPVVVSRTTGSDGTFSYKVPASKLAIYKLYSASDNFILLLVTGQSIELQLNSEKLSFNPAINGSDDTRFLYEIARRSSVYDKQLDSLNKAFNEARGNPELLESLPNIQASYEQTVQNQKQAIKEALVSDPGSPATLFFIDKLDTDTDLDIYIKVSDALFARFPEYKMVADLKTRVDLEKKLQPGNQAPEISLPDKDGKIVLLSSLRGKVVMIDFWASWCGPCRRDNPEVVRMYNRFKDKGFDIFGVSLDRDAAAWLGAIEKDGLVWTQVSDLKYWQSEGAKAYGVSSIPHTVLIDRDGKIIARKLRGKVLESKLEEIFGTN